MTLTDLLIIYLAFGAPIAVYKYLQNRTVDIRRRVSVATFTFFFWLPAAIEIAYPYLTNAYCRDVFVSLRELDANYLRLDDLRESVSTELIKITRGSGVHDLRETVDRYAGLADAVRNSGEQTKAVPDLFDAAGREKSDLGPLCLMRRNLRRLDRHHTQARQDFVMLFEQNVDRGDVLPDVISMGIGLARQVEDNEGVIQLRALKARVVEEWNSTQQEQRHAMAAVPSIAMTASLNND